MLEEIALSCEEAFSKQRTQSIFVEEIPLIVSNNMQMYWTVQPILHHCQRAQYSDPRMLVKGDIPSSSTKIQPQSPRRRYARSHPRRGTCRRCHESSTESYADVASVKTMSNGEQKSRVNGYQGTICRVLSQVASKLGYFSVWLRHSHRIKRCPVTVNANRLVAIREANRNLWLFLNQRGLHRSSWANNR